MIVPLYHLCDYIISLYYQHRKNDTEQWTYYQEQIGGGNTSYVMKGLEPNTDYWLRLSAKNVIGPSSINGYPLLVRTLEKGIIYLILFLFKLIHLLW